MDIGNKIQVIRQRMARCTNCDYKKKGRVIIKKSQETPYDKNPIIKNKQYWCYDCIKKLKKMGIYEETHN